MGIVYEGPSRLDRDRTIIVVVTGHSENLKTGDMLQVWILDRDESPLGDRKAICGDCPLTDGRCYVRWYAAPHSVWKKYHRGGYERINDIPKLTRGMKVRLGAAGEPSAMPVRVLKALVRDAEGWTGYTHQWRRFPSLRRYLMASVESVEEAKEAHKLGWRTFRTTTEDKGTPFPSWGVMDGEFTCPTKYRKDINCAKCLACNGKRDETDRRASVVMPVHGSVAILKKWS